VDPLEYPRCSGAPRIIAFIEQPEVIEKILTQLNLWLAPAPAILRPGTFPRAVPPKSKMLITFYCLHQGMAGHGGC